MHNVGVICFEIALEASFIESLLLNAPAFRGELPRDDWTHKGSNLISRSFQILSSKLNGFKSPNVDMAYMEEVDY